MNRRAPRVMARIAWNLRGMLPAGVRRGFGILGWVVVLACGTAVASGGAAEEARPVVPAAAALLYPPADAVLTNDTVQILGVMLTGQTNPTLSLDGQPIETERYTFARNWPKKYLPATNQPPSAVARLLDDKAKVSLALASSTLSPGAHLLVFAGVTNRLVRLPPGPAGEASKKGAIFRPHPSPNDPAKPVACATCHEVDQAASRLGRARMPDSCIGCHTPVDLRLIHSHVMEPLAKCTLCHDPHGSARASLLRDDKARLCTQCHEAGHFRN